jgi:hypothetical protein
MDIGVSTRELKALAVSMLPPTSALRDLIMSDPDTIPNEDVRVKLKVYSRLLHHEMSGRKS